MADTSLIKRPIAEILTTARAAGRIAFTTRETLDSVWEEISFAWMEKTMPESLGMSDVDFNSITDRASEAFGEGVDEYLALVEGNKPDGAEVVQALEREVKGEQFQVQCAQEVFVWLASIFYAIERAADACPDVRSRGEIKRLAGCGNYLASDRADMLSDYAGEEDTEASNG